MTEIQDTPVINLRGAKLVKLPADQIEEGKEAFSLKIAGKEGLTKTLEAKEIVADIRRRVQKQGINIDNITQVIIPSSFSRQVSPSSKTARNLTNIIGRQFPHAEVTHEGINLSKSSL